MAPVILLAQAIPDGIGEWLKYGLLGLVLLWLCFVHLPAKDRQNGVVLAVKDEQIKEALAMQALEREKERADRHDRANAFQKTLNEMAIDHRQQLKDIADQHDEAANKDRTAFESRNENVRLAIDNQTLRIEAALKTTCQYRPEKIQEKLT